jgi:hypothetical protein
MTEVQKRQYPTTVSADEFHALPDVVQEAYEADGDTFVAEETKLAEALARDADEESTGDDVDQDDEPVDDHISDEPVEFDDELLTKFELSEAEFSSLPEDIQGGYEFKFGKWRAVPEMREAIEKCMAAYAEAMAERDATIAESRRNTNDSTGS